MKFIKISPYKTLPCEAEVFEIHGMEAYKSDFGYQGDVGSDGLDDVGSDGLDDDENSACWDNQFTPHKDVDQEVLNKYGISEQEYRKIQDELKTKFAIGGCALCV